MSEIIRHSAGCGRRVPEQDEIMLGAHAFSYANADYRAVHTLLASALEEDFGTDLTGTIVDLGCGPGDITLSIARQYPYTKVLGIDDSEDALDIATARLFGETKLGQRVRFSKGHIPFDSPPIERADVIVSINTLHQFQKSPQSLWDCIKDFAKIGAPVLIVDLVRRVKNMKLARSYVESQIPEADDVAKNDFAHSLRAAWTTEQVRNQLNAAGLPYFQVRHLGERHMVISGRYMGEIVDGIQKYDETIPESRSKTDLLGKLLADEFDFPKGWSPWKHRKMSSDCSLGEKCTCSPDDLIKLSVLRMETL